MREVWDARPSRARYRRVRRGTGVAGRHESDSSQELNYRASAKAIADTGFPGYVAHEFLPLGDRFTAFADAYRIFDV